MIRNATELDIPELLCFAKEFLEYYPIDFGGNLTTIEPLLVKMVHSDILIVYEDGGVIVGVIGGIISPHLYSSTSIAAYETFLWVSKEYRNIGIADILINEFENKSMEEGCDIVIMTSTTRTPTFEKYLLISGYSPVETSYMKRI